MRNEICSVDKWSQSPCLTYSYPHTPYPSLSPQIRQCNGKQNINQIQINLNQKIAAAQSNHDAPGAQLRLICHTLTATTPERQTTY